MTTKRKGFTLIEIIIVVAIIAILASAVIIAINPAKNLRNARNATRWSHMNSVANGIYTYVIDQKGIYPSCLYDAITGARIVYVPAGPPPWNLININTCLQLVPAYFPQFPAEPQGKNYVIGFVSSDLAIGTIIIRSTAQEAIDENILVIQ